MKFKIIYLLGLMVIISCNKFDGPYIETIESGSVSISGGGQKTSAGTYFSDSIGIAVYNHLTDYSTTGYKAVFSVISGGGMLDDEIVTLKSGIAKTRWKSGMSSCKQQVRVQIFDNNDNLINKLTLEAYAFRSGVWDTIVSNPDRFILDVLADTLRKQTFMITYNGFFKEGSNYFDWYQLPSIIQNPFSLHADLNAVLYTGTWNGQIFKSTDGGINWNLCTNPIPGHIYFYYMTVSNNGYLYTSSPEYKKSLRCSRDGGNTWSADTIGIEENELFGDVYKLSNGEMLFHSSGIIMYKSVNDGKSWQIANCPQYSTKLFVTEKEEIIIFNQENGVSIHKSTDFGKTYRKVHSVWPEYGTSMSKIIQKRGSYYYILIPGFGVIRTVDFETFETFYRNNKITYLYQTHDGVLIARGFDYTAAYYYRD